MESSEGHEWQISQVVAGESHTLALTGDGKLFAWGKGLFGRLGNGSIADQCVPLEVHFIPYPHSDDDGLILAAIKRPRPKVVSVAAGAYHSLALTDDGTVWSWGYNIYGQLGHENSDDAIPHSIQRLSQGAEDILGQEARESLEDRKVSRVATVEAGGMMSCAIDHRGGLWMWGQCPLPSSSTHEQPFALSVCESPRPVTILQGLSVAKVACGYEHILALVHDEKLAGKFVCYAWGNNRYGQLGLGDRESRPLPTHVQALLEQNAGTLSHVSCGAFHSAAITHDDETAMAMSNKRVSMCWTFGMGENGQLGHGRAQNSALPEMVEGLPKDERITAVSCGLFHMGVVTVGGGVWTWGMERGLGLCPGLGPPGVEAGDYLSPVRERGDRSFERSCGVELACGAAHNVLTVKDGEFSRLWAWGRGQNGVLGVGQSVDSWVPCPVVWPPGMHTQSGTADSDGPDKLGLSSGQQSMNSDTEQMLALAQREICALTTELVAAKQHCSELHAALFGDAMGEEPSRPGSMRAVLKELDRKVAASSYDNLVNLDEFYRQARSRVKEALFQKKVENHCKQLLRSLEK